jgi:hypothetical protein
MKRSDPTRYLKSAGIGFVLGLGAGWRVHALGAAEEIAGWIESKFQTEISAVKAAGRGLGVSNLVEALLAFAYGPALPVTVGLTIAAVVAIGLLKEFFERATIDRIWPSYPDILDPKLERDNVARYRPLAAGTPFFERGQELENLVCFAEDFSGPGVTFQFLAGREGVGKTRLALEWLKKMKARGWDAGILDPKADISEIRFALLRNKTAILIDEPGRIQNFWLILDALLQKKTRIRIVLANQIALRRPNSLDDDARARIEMAQRGTMKLRGMTDDTLRKLVRNASDKQLKDAEGCPLMVLIGPKDFSEIERRVALREESAEARDVGRVLALAALAGPVARTEVDRALGMSVATSSLEPLFEDVDRATLDAILPAFAPEVFANEIVLRHALDHPGDNKHFFELAIRLNAAAVEHRCASLWRRGGNDRRAKVIDALIATLEEVAPARRDKALARAVELVVETSKPPPADDDGAVDLAPLTGALDELEELAESRPFSRGIRQMEARGAVNAIDDYGRAGQWEALEHWGVRLIALCEMPGFRDDPAISRQGAAGAANAISHYGRAKQFPVLERWGARLIALCETPLYFDNRDIRLAEGKGAFNAMVVYGEAGQFEALERWAARLTALAEMPAFRDDRDIRVLEANSMVNAIGCYGRAQQLQPLERWATRLVALGEMPGFRDDREVRALEASGTVNALIGYGMASQFDAMERWGARLIALCEAPGFRDDRNIRLQEAKGAYSAMNLYGAAKQFQALERWGARLIALCEEHGFSDDRDIRFEEAKSAYNAIMDYRDAGQFEALERWGGRLIALCEMPRFHDDREIRLLEAKVAVSIINGYGNAGQFEALERWGGRLIALCELPNFREDREIRLQEVISAINAIAYYGAARKFDVLERWGERLTALCRTPRFRDDREIRLREFQAAANAIVLYSKHAPAAGAARSRWFAQASAVARDFPADLEIQQAAPDLGISYVQQQIKGWPYGRPRAVVQRDARPR